MNWNEYFMQLVEQVALKSKDNLTKLGAVVVGPDHEIRATGYNSFPRGINDNIPERQIRPEKYSFIEHAERNAFYNAARHGASLNGCNLYCNWLPCTNCARGIIQVGIVKVIVKSFDVPDRWAADMAISITMLKEAGVEIQRFDSADPTDWDKVLKIDESMPVSYRDQFTKILLGSYTLKGVDSWFGRSLSCIGGQTPQNILDARDVSSLKLLMEHLLMDSGAT